MSGSIKTARNKLAKSNADIIRAAIRKVLVAHSPLKAPLTAKTVGCLLQLPITERAIAWHIQQIRHEAAAEIAAIAT